MLTTWEMLKANLDEILKSN